ncbi:dimethylhistidine N-methyltransferase [Phialophora macrospora]|uniref:Dimethylhistidine N-methyltransferase n=1 Tax=Phialophora macrospora TaxID=1851006 RepID=A0A0D2FWY0_9EURO|nr:dimethylhistidine N-methyltransferase [Phialophora macrospora]
MATHTSAGVPILDIRRDKSDQSLVETLKQSLNPSQGQPRTFPTLLLYDEKGLKLFEDITYLDEYYLTNAEIEALKLHADEIVARIPEGSRLVELGSGNLRKVNILLEAFERAQKTVEYFALDLSLSELRRTFAELDTSVFHYVSFHALHGTYDDALSWLEKTRTDRAATCVMTMGSSLGNFTPEGAAKFLASFKKALAASDFMLVGLDACQQPERVFRAYHDSQHVTEQFYRNGLLHANNILGYEAFKPDEWEVEGFYDEESNKHQASYVALKTIHVKDFHFEKGEKIHFEDAFKYSEAESDALWHAAGFILQMSYGNENNDYHIHLLSPSSINFPTKPAEFAASPVPSRSDWSQLWAAWDTVTKSMVPRDELLNKPIKLRNDLIFYLGHIPTFADIHYTKATARNPTDPAFYRSIFERGIDPDVDNPELCHDHSEVPDAWPPLKEILDYSERVRARIVESIESGLAYTDRRLGRALWLAYEHEAMHLETFVYMLLQSERILPPPGQGSPDFRALAAEARAQRVENKWHRIPASEVKLGLDDPENDMGPDRYFGWDNERPSRSVTVHEFEAQSRPISNGEYAHFLEVTLQHSLPASWTTLNMNGQSNGTNGVNGDAKETVKMASSAFLEGKAIRTVYGLVPLKYALDWPVMASYDELAAFAEWSGGRIPTLEEARSLYQYVEEQKSILQKVPSKLISAVNGHLSNDGVEETPPSGRLSNGAVNGRAEHSKPDPRELFIELDDRNVAFRHWHPTPVTGNGSRLCGQSDLGGLWEWTSTPLAPHEGFKAMDLYPGYTADFFDGKHNICLGGSWATVPRIALKKTFVNWYQRNYPYVWCTTRLVREVAV